MNNKLTNTILKQTGLTKTKYNNLIKNEWHLNSCKEILKHKLADEVINLRM